MTRKGTCGSNKRGAFRNDKKEHTKAMKQETRENGMAKEGEQPTKSGAKSRCRGVVQSMAVRFMEERLAQAKAIIQEEVERAGLSLQQVFLFGSRARGGAHPESDWDFLVVVDQKPERSIRLRLETRIGVRLVLARMPADVLILSEEEFASQKEDTGYVAYYAVRESIPL